MTQFFIFLVYLDEAAVDAAEAYGPAAQGGQISRQAFVDLAGQDHLHHFHGVIVGDAEAVFEMGLDGQFLQHGADFRSSAVNEDNLDAYQLEKKNVLHH